MTQGELELIRRLNEQIRVLLLRIGEIRATGPEAIKYDKIGGSRSAPTNRTEKIVELIDRKEARADRLIDKRYDLVMRAVKEIRAACEDQAERHILYLRYLGVNKEGRSLSWSEVIQYANKHHNIQERRVYSLHHIAIARLRHHNI